MIKTRLELLEKIHDSVHEEKLRMEIAIKNLDGVPDDEVIDTVVKRSPLGAREQNITKKDLVDRYTEDIKKRKKVLEIVKKLLKTDGKEVKDRNG